MAVRIEAAALPSEVWISSGALFEQVPTLAASSPPRPYPRPLDCSSGPILSHLP